MSDTVQAEFIPGLGYVQRIVPKEKALVIQPSDTRTNAEKAMGFEEKHIGDPGHKHSTSVEVDAEAAVDEGMDKVEDDAVTEVTPGDERRTEDQEPENTSGGKKVTQPKKAVKHLSTPHAHSPIAADSSDEDEEEEVTTEEQLKPKAGKSLQTKHQNLPHEHVQEDVVDSGGQEEWTEGEEPDDDEELQGTGYAKKGAPVKYKGEKAEFVAEEEDGTLTIKAKDRLWNVAKSEVALIEESIEKAEPREVSDGELMARVIGVMASKGS